MTKPHPHDCPKCYELGGSLIRMESKAILQDGTKEPPMLWQCPVCKSIEVKS